jgi:hypothetical protein
VDPHIILKTALQQKQPTILKNKSTATRATHNLQNSICNQSNPQNLLNSIATKATHNLHTSTATKLNHNLHNAKKLLLHHKHEIITNPNTPTSTTTTTTNMKQT